MASLQYIIDTICTSVTAESLYELMKARLKQGSFIIDEVLPLIQSKDRSLDLKSAKILAEAALEELEQCGNLRIDNGCIYPLP
jgi:hypothetical protein